MWGGILGVVDQTIRDLREFTAVRTDGVNVETIRVPAGAILCSPVAVSCEHDTFTVRGPARCIVPSRRQGGSFASRKVEDLQTLRSIGFHIPETVDHGRTIWRQETGVLRTIFTSPIREGCAIGIEFVDGSAAARSASDKSEHNCIQHPHTYWQFD